MLYQLRKATTVLAVIEVLVAGLAIAERAYAAPKRTIAISMN